MGHGMRRFFSRIGSAFQRLGDAFRSRRQLGERIDALLATSHASESSHRREIEALNSRIQILEIERDALLEIIERDRERVRAEIANYAAAKELAGYKTMQGIG